MNRRAFRAIFFFSMIGSVALNGCDRTITPPRHDAPLVQISDIAPELLKKDQFTIGNSVIEDLVLTMTISSGGGCEDHEYSLTMTPSAFMESFPVQANLYLWHDANDDPCDAIITDSVTFDLAPIVELYQQMYGSTGQIYLNLYNFEQTESTRLALKIR